MYQDIYNCICRNTKKIRFIICLTPMNNTRSVSDAWTTPNLFQTQKQHPICLRPMNNAQSVSDHEQHPLCLRPMNNTHNISDPWTTPNLSQTHEQHPLCLRPLDYTHPWDTCDKWPQYASGPWTTPIIEIHVISGLNLSQNSRLHPSSKYMWSVVALCLRRVDNSHPRDTCDRWWHSSLDPWTTTILEIRVISGDSLP